MGLLVGQTHVGPQRLQNRSEEETERHSRSLAVSKEAGEGVGGLDSFENGF